MLAAHNITDDDIRSFCDDPTMEKGFLNWPWVLATLRALDSAGGGSWAVKLFTYDVFAYLTHPGVRDVIDTGVRRLFDTEPAVVVSHSLGTVVAYDLLRRDGTENKWSVPTFITLGSPLSVNPIAHRLAPIKFPSCVGKWFTARDPLDTVALHPLVPPYFPDFQITAKDDVKNTSDNHHGIVQYLSDPDVALWICDAMARVSP
jgi:pimeloyl-ACP methyl ester carboxylesterase